MSATSVSVVVPLGQPGSSPAGKAIAAYLETTGLTYEILNPEGAHYGVAVRRGVSEAKGSVIVIADPELPYPVSAIGDAVAMGSRVRPTSSSQYAYGLRRTTLYDGLSCRAAGRHDPSGHASSGRPSRVRRVAAQLPSCELEVAFLSNKYGFRVEYLVVHPAEPLRGRSFVAVRLV